MFPDSSEPQSTNGGFQTQDEFRNWLLGKQNGQWHSEVHARPTAEKIQDYKDSTIADAFPLQFPYGITCLPKDPFMEPIYGKKRKTKRYKRDRYQVFRKFLQHRNPNFHKPLFNLVIENIIMKETIFQKAQMYCNCKSKDNIAMGNKYGLMTAKQLERAIQDNRNNTRQQYSSAPEHQFLKSIRSACGNLPHSKEAAMEARRILFSYIMRFGFPAIFLTITPDDRRNFRIVIYSCLGKEKKTNYNISDFTDDDILFKYNLRKKAAVDYPGLCAEEYEHIIDLVVKHVFNWDVAEQKSNGIGLFAKVNAWSIATEEQGRKNLHGHFLVFVEDWSDVLQILQRKDGDEFLSYRQAIRKTSQFFNNACSARLFQDFKTDQPLDEHAVFEHSQCRGKRRNNRTVYHVSPVDAQAFREMRHKSKCHEHNGVIAKCNRCPTTFSINDLIASALNTHLGKKNHDRFKFPEYQVKHLDFVVYEMHKDFEWTEGTEKEKAIRYFAANTISNMHFTTHATRCFKKGPECFANLPDVPSEKFQVLYDTDNYTWTDYLGNKEIRSIFRLHPTRNLEDAFINTHNKSLTDLLLCNTNVLLGMNGCIVHYVTCYKTKDQQKEENHAFENMSTIMLKHLAKQVCLLCVV